MELENRNKVTKKVTLVGALVNAVLASAQIACGFFGQSQALLADGIHTLSDLSSDFVVLFATSQSARAADREHPYGHGRIETLASLLLGVVLAIVGLSLSVRGWFSIFTIDKPNPEIITVLFAALAVASKELLYRYTIKAAKKFHSTLLESNAMHHRSDALSSIVVLVGISAQLMGVENMDAIAAIVVGLMIIYMGYRLARKSLSELIDSSLDRQLVEDIESTISNNNEVKDIHSLRSRSMGGLGYVDAEIRVNPRLTVSEAHHIAFSLEEQIKVDFPQVIDVSIHIDPMTETEHDDVTHLPSRNELLDKLHETWTSGPISQQIIQVNLHYLDRQIEVDIILPMALSKIEHQASVQQLIDLASELKDVGRVSLYFKQ